MNYYEHHIRDYDAATSHLTWDEDLAYTRLIRWYYRKEKPIPADIKEACRQVRATSKLQRESVENVLAEFFILRDDGWHNETCDEVIARFRDGEPEREVKKANEENRLKRHRDERAKLFKTLTDAGEHAPWNIKMEDLREMVERVSAQQPETLPDTKPETPATAPETPATATQSPITNHQTPVVNPLPKSVSCTQTELREQPVASTRKGVVCGLLRKAGMADAAPHYLPDEAWEAILSKRTDEEIVEVALAKMAARPGQRTGLKYIAPALMEDPAPIPFNTQRPATGRQAAIDNYAAQAAAARGETHERTTASERDITGESFRVA